MGRDLYYTIPQFFEKALDQHQMVIAWKRVDHPSEDNDYLYLIMRNRGFSEMLVHASDEYSYSLTHYFQKPDKLDAGSFIYVARPEASYDFNIVEVAQKDRISIGKFAAIMGALYIEDHWDYIPKERRKTNKIRIRTESKARF